MRVHLRLPDLLILPRLSADRRRLAQPDFAQYYAKLARIAGC